MPDNTRLFKFSSFQPVGFTLRNFDGAKLLISSYPHHNKKGPPWESLFCGERGALKSYSNPRFAKLLEIIGLNLLIVSYLYIFLFVTYLQYLSHFWVAFSNFSTTFRNTLPFENQCPIRLRTNFKVVLG